MRDAALCRVSTRSGTNFPAEQAPVIQLLVERVVAADGLDVRLRTDGLANLTADLNAVSESRRQPNVEAEDQQRGAHHHCAGAAFDTEARRPQASPSP